MRVKVQTSLSQREEGKEGKEYRPRDRWEWGEEGRSPVVQDKKSGSRKGDGG